MRKRALDRWFPTFFESLPDAFVVFDSTGAILAANPAVAEQLGYAPDELLGRAIGVILPTLAGELASVTGASLRSAGYEALHRDGTIVPLEVTLAPIQSVERSLVLARLGERPRSARTEALASVGAEPTSTVLDGDFLSTLMHELRTPLQAMLGWTQLLRSAPRDPQAIEQGLAAIERNVQWQAQVVEDLLELARIRSGDLRLETRRVRPTGVLGHAVEQISSAARSKGVRLIQRVEDDRGEILADPDRLAQVIWRLLFDAVRYSSEGGEVEIRLERVGSSIRITITDDGGADDPASSHASGWFRRFEAASAADFSRFGVGLSNVQRVVQLHGGQVGAETAGPRRGASFFMTLPLVAESDGA